VKFTGFWEARGPDVDEMATTITKATTDDLLARLRVRLESVPSGTHVRIDLIAGDGEP
jgi:hypothetical protein